MNNLTVEQRLRNFLVWVTIFTLSGTLFELFLLQHYEENVQYLPFVLSTIGILTLLAARFKPTKNTLLTLRWFMGLIALGSLIGMYFHFDHNMAVIQYKNPVISFSGAIWPAIAGGTPLMAPGILFLAGALGVAVTYKHPTLEVK